MLIGVPRESHSHEHRVGLTPSAAGHLCRQGHDVLIEAGAGDDAHFRDADYQQAGARIVYDRDEAYGRPDLLARVGPLNAGELELLRPGQWICGFHHLAVAPRAQVEALQELEATVIGYEIVRDAEGGLPVLLPLSELAGQLAVHTAAHYLQNEAGGRGILLGNVPGVPPPTVLVLGAGTVGSTAARQAAAIGAHVLVVDPDLSKLRHLTQELDGHVVTATPGQQRLARFAAIADVVIGAVLIPGRRAPFVLSEDMVRGMKPGSVIIDVAVDQGGCVETSRPTDLQHPTFEAHGVTHYCVPNMTANIARTACRALANAALPTLTALAADGAAALRADAGLRQGVYLYQGHLVHPDAADTLGLPATPLDRLLREEAPTT